MALGLPVLVTRVGGLHENVTAGQEGWIVPEKDPAAIADVLREILAEPQQLQRLGDQARARAVREFNLPDFVAQTLAVYQSVLKS